MPHMKPLQTHKQRRNPTEEPPWRTNTLANSVEPDEMAHNETSQTV